MHYVFCWGLTAESWVLATGVGLSPWRGRVRPLRAECGDAQLV